jgi:hypothetical protein
LWDDVRGGGSEGTCLAEGAGMNTILDAALGVAVVFAVFALVVSGLNEAWASFMNKRGKQLFDALNQIMDDKAHELLTTELLQPLTRQPRVTVRNPPSARKTAVAPVSNQDEVRKATGAYLPSWMFAAAVLEKAEKASDAPAPLTASTEDKAKSLVDELGGPLAGVVQTLVKEADNDVHKLEKALAKWYDGYMERVAGWYKRNARWIMFVIALVVAIAANIDAVSLTREVISDASVRGALVQQASSISNCKGGDLTCAKQDVAALPGSQLGLFWTTTCVSKSAPGTNAPKAVLCSSSWTTRQGLDNFWEWFDKVAGLLIGALAISLGAPFWFDLIGRGVSLKGAGPEPAPAPSNSSSATTT